MVLNFEMLNNSAFKKAINNFGKFYSLKNIYKNIKICLTLCHITRLCHGSQNDLFAISVLQVISL